MDRLEAMSLFVDVVECGNLSAVGRKLDIPLATVSRRIADLEAYLKTRLLIRASRKVSLTDAGAEYLETCRQVLDLVHEAERSAAGEYNAPKGGLVITASVAFGQVYLGPIVNEFLEKYPEINIRLLLSDRTAHLIDDHIDLAVRIGALPDSSMMVTRVGFFRRIVCGSPALLTRHGRPNEPAELPGFPCVAHEFGEAINSWNFPFKGTESDETVAIRPRLAVTSAQAAVDAALAGIGLTRLLCYQVAKHIASGHLETVLDDSEPPQLPVNLLHVGQGRMPFKVRCFLDFAGPRLRQALAANALPQVPRVP
ncbi:MAG: LysR family transcriptional regulator [Alphaproteobacteria bacterium]|nr:LysR family transcriptional regulator [Alphaproteobacteria bacterium]